MLGRVRRPEWLIVFAALTVGGCAGRPRGGEEPGFVPLFNGRDLSGWVAVNGGPDTWTARDGMLVCSGRPSGMLRTARMFENFVLELDWKHPSKGGNSGLFVWADALPARGEPYPRSVEVQVMDGRETPNYTSDGDIFSIHGARLVPARPHPAGWQRCLPSEKRCKPSPEWNHYLVTCDGGTIRLAVNGKEVSSASGVVPSTGYLCLESEGSEVHFRNLRIRELPSKGPPPDRVAEPDRGFRGLFNGVGFAGWKENPEKAGHWTAKDGVLDYDGKGDHLWSLEEFGDFELIADWRWSGPTAKKAVPVVLPNGEVAVDGKGERRTVEIDEAGDSGIYLRGNDKSQVNIWCWPIGSGEVYGYRTDPNASPEVRAAVTPRVAADAPLGAWNRFHVTMKGERLTVVLNGKTVIEDARLPGVPAKGRIALQHHDSPIQFANLFVREMR
ncbi:MAG TPA: DUF1080 domain-containing protein [Planctomycetota bacterium]|jgi:hypothetical protein|nr:DUF1080 domain-containing protein [Planctomycetota bacterium]